MNRINFNKPGGFKWFGTDLNFIHESIVGPLSIFFASLCTRFPLVIITGMENQTVNEDPYVREYNEGWAIFNGEIVYFPAQIVWIGDVNADVFFYVEEMVADYSTRILSDDGTNVDVLYTRQGKLSLTPPEGVEAQLWTNFALVPKLIHAIKLALEESDDNFM